MPVEPSNLVWKFGPLQTKWNPRPPEQKYDVRKPIAKTMVSPPQKPRR